VANIGIGMNNSVVGAKPVEPYRAGNMTQGMAMVVTEDLTIFGPLLGGRAQVGGVAIADAEETAAVTSRLGNASAATAAREVDAVAGSSNAARREAMREGGIPTSQQPRSQVRSPHGNSYEYNVNRQNNRSSDKTIQGQ
jgi:hypothetical protein